MTADDVTALTDEVRATNAMLGQVVERLDRADLRQTELATKALELAEETRKVAKATHRHRIGSGVLALCVIGLGVLAVSFRQDQINERYRTCIRSNQIRADIRQSIVDTVELLATTRTEPAELVAIVEAVEANLAETLPDRVCT